jgi:hypothetical protein
MKCPDVGVGYKVGLIIPIGEIIIQRFIVNSCSDTNKDKYGNHKEKLAGFYETRLFGGIFLYDFICRHFSANLMCCKYNFFYENSNLLPHCKLIGKYLKISLRSMPG